MKKMNLLFFKTKCIIEVNLQLYKMICNTLRLVITNIHNGHGGMRGL